MADIMTDLSDAMTGKSKPRTNYVEQNRGTPMKKKAKKPAKKDVASRRYKKPAKKAPAKKVDIKASMTGKDVEPKREEKSAGTPTIVNDIKEVANPQMMANNERGASMMEQVQKEAPNYLVGLAPLAMGAIMGDIGAGASIGGDMMLQQETRKMNFDEKRRLASLKAKNDGQPKRGMYQWKNYEKPDGSIGLMKVNTATGEAEETDKLAGFKRSVTKDPVTGELASISGSRVDDNYKEITPHEGFNVAQQKYQKDFRDTLLKDKQFQSYRKSNASSGQALTMLQANNPIGDKAILTIMPRIMGEVGNLTAAEQAAYSGSPLFTRKLEALQEKLVNTGGFTEADRADLMEVAKVMQMHSQAMATELLGRYKESEQNIRGYDPSSAVDVFDEPSSVTPKSVVKDVKRKAPTAGKPKQMSNPNPMREGYIDIFELSPMGEYNYVKTIKGE